MFQRSITSRVTARRDSVAGTVRWILMNVHPILVLMVVPVWMVLGHFHATAQQVSQVTLLINHFVVILTLETKQGGLT